MKRFFTALLFICSASMLMAQQENVVDTTSVNSKLRVAATAGIGFSNVRMVPQSPGKKSILHYRVGALVDYFLRDHLFLESGLSFAQEGYRSLNANFENEDKYRFHLYYLTIPVTVNYMIPVEKVWLEPQLGTFFNIAVAGNKKGSITQYENENPIKHTREINDNLFEKDQNRYRRFDCGLRLGINVFFIERYRLGVAYDLGFVNLYKLEHKGSEVKIQNGTFSVNFAYCFDLNKKKQKEEDAKEEGETE